MLDDKPGSPAVMAARARAMAETLIHRGPDDSGVWAASDGSVALAHRRLSIVDLSPLGRNPMTWDDGRLWITFNGEIYNFRELRRELQEHGHRFRTKTDTEVILAAYDQWGVECLTKLVGMFAFALWDQQNRRLWLVRDRLGKKPLFYAQHPGCLIFASELKALLTDDALPRTIDRTALAMYLHYGYVPAPHSIFAGARKLAPAHYLLCEHGRTIVRRYWDPFPCAEEPVERSVEDAEHMLTSLLTTAVAERQVADVPLGAFLSGGVDSSLVVALMQERMTAPVQTFTIRFDDPEYNEADHAAAVARHLGTEHYEQVCDAGQMLAVVDRLPGMFDEPFADSSAVPTFLLAAVARTRVTVALSGDGADELFFGYPRYRHMVDSAWALKLPKSLRKAGARAARRLPTRRLRRIGDVLGGDDADPYARFIGWWTADAVRRMTGVASFRAPAYSEVMNRAAQLPRQDVPPLADLVTYLPDDILAKVDRAAMAVSLEVRSPMLDHRVVEFALGLPHALKRREGETKWLLRRLLHRRVPRRLVDRPKAGFGVPLETWLRGPLRERMDDYCASDDLENLGLDPSPTRECWREFSAGRSRRADLLWQMFSLIGWSRSISVGAPGPYGPTGTDWVEARITRLDGARE